MKEFPTGAKRSSRTARYDLIPKVFWDRVAKRFTGELLHEGDTFTNRVTSGGALKYGECNWEKGLPTSDVINHILDHITAWADEFRGALKITGGNMERIQMRMTTLSKDEDHLAGAAFGLAVLMYQEVHGMFHDDLFEKPVFFQNQKPLIPYHNQYAPPTQTFRSLNSSGEYPEIGIDPDLSRLTGVDPNDSVSNNTKNNRTKSQRKNSRKRRSSRRR